MLPWIGLSSFDADKSNSGGEEVGESGVVVERGTVDLRLLDGNSLIVLVRLDQDKVVSGDGGERRCGFFNDSDGAGFKLF